MIEQLFFRSDALTRQLSAPLVDETSAISSSMCDARNDSAHHTRESSTSTVNHRVSEIG
jgi:hypothetical protein